MVAGEVGVQIQVFPYASNESNGITLANSTCILIVRSPFDIVTEIPLVVSNDTTFAYRNTIATDFLTGGSYDLQFIATFNDGTILKSKIQSIDVDWAIAPA